MKKIIVIAAAAAISLLAAGCGEKAPAAGSTAAQASTSDSGNSSNRKFSGGTEAEESKPEESKTGESKPEESKPEESGQEKSKQEESGPEESKPAEPGAGTGEVKPLELLIGTGYDFDGVDVTDESNEHYPWAELYKSDWQMLYLPEYLNGEYPELSAALEDANGKVQAEMEEYGARYRKEAREFFEKDPDYFMAFEAALHLGIQRADSEVLSVMKERVLYEGGAHEGYFYGGDNFDVRTGKEIALTDVVKDMDSLKKVLGEYLNRDYPDDLMVEIPETFKDYKPEDFGWTLGADGITFYFSPYEIASFSAGMLPVCIRFDEKPELFTGKYQNAVEEYISSVIPYTRYLCDADGDGKTDVLQVNADTDEYGTMDKLHILLNGKDCPFDFYAFSLKTHFAVTKEGRFLLLNGSMENDYSFLQIYRLDGKKPERTAELFGMGPAWYYDAYNGTSAGSAFVDPENLTLSKNCDIMGTYDAFARHRLGKDGIPEKLDELWAVEYPMSITSKRDLQLEVLKDVEDTGTGSAEKFPAGTTFTFAYTDGETYVNCLTGGGKAVRLSPEQVDWEWTINGENIFDLFENIMFAG